MRGRSEQRVQGVSPVVGMLLLVAITIVLAAVLYIMAAGLIGGGTTPPPTVSLVASPAGAQAWTADVQSDRASSLNNFRVSVRNVTSGDLCVTETDLTATLDVPCDGALRLTFEDLASPGSATLNGGDRFLLSGVVDGYPYAINLVWKPTGGIIISVIVGDT